jgi:TPR repeat protein
MVYLGVAYQNGTGVSKDPVEAMNWQERAATRGNAMAMENVGVMFRSGIGVSANMEKAIEWTRKAANAGNANAEFDLGEHYFLGDGVPEDHGEAARWFAKAIEHGDQSAIQNLANQYSQGDGVAKDTKKAYELYMKAADDAGSASSAFNVAEAYLGHGDPGCGIPIDQKKALHYMEIAADGGEMSAILAVAGYAHDVEHDSNKYKKYMEMAADTGYKPALFIVAGNLLHIDVADEDLPSDISNIDIKKAQNYLDKLKGTEDLSYSDSDLLRRLRQRLEFLSMKTGANTAN